MSKQIKNALRILNQTLAQRYTHRCNKCLRTTTQKQLRRVYRCPCGGKLYSVQP